MGVLSFDGGRRVIASKRSDQTISSDDSLGNDNDLFFFLDAYERRKFKLIAKIDSDTTADFKFAFSTPSGVTGWFTGYFVDAPTTTPGTSAQRGFAGDDITDEIADAAVADENILVIEGVVHGGAVPGHVRFTWAQNTSNASDTTVLKDSYIESERLPSD